MKNMGKGLALGLTLNGLVFAADAPSRGADSAPQTTPVPQTPAPIRGGSGATNGTPAVSPSGGGTTNRPIDSQPGTSSQMRGRVKSIDSGGNRIRIEDGRGQVSEFQINKDTDFTFNGKPSRFSDVKTGDEASFETGPNSNILKLNVGTKPK